MSSKVNQFQEVLQWHLPWHKARVKFISAFILSVIKLTTVNFTKLANALNGKAKKKSNYRRIQRFFAEFSLSYDVVVDLILHLLPIKSDFTISIDRTNWDFGKLSINILTAGIVYQGVAFPIAWMLLPKKGNSNTQERITLMEQLLKRVDKALIKEIVADREFIGQEWFGWLKVQDLGFAIRIKENATTPNGKGDIALRDLFGDLQIYQQHILRKPRLIYGHYLYLSVIRLPDEFVIVASYQKGPAPLEAYKKRWGIEVLFAALKSRGFDLEETHLIHLERIEKLVALLAIAFAWAHLVGEWIAQTEPLKIKKHGRKEQSLFRYGLDHLQYVLLNIQDQIQQFFQAIWLFLHPLFPRPI
jgi:hypothetical protein